MTMRRDLLLNIAAAPLAPAAAVTAAAVAQDLLHATEEDEANFHLTIQSSPGQDLRPAGARGRCRPLAQGNGRLVLPRAGH